MLLSMLGSITMNLSWTMDDIVKILCPGCYQEVDVKPDANGQVKCPLCGGWYPLSFAKKLRDFEANRKRFGGKWC